MYEKNIKKQRYSWISLILPILLIALWEWSVDSGVVPNTLIASPSQVARDLLNFVINGTLALHSIVSLFRLIIGFVVGAGLGLILGVIVGTSKFTEKVINPTLQFFSPIPPIAWIPLLIILLGIGEASKIALILIGSFFVVYLNTIQGIRSVDQKLVDLAYVYKKSDWELVNKILLPSAIPNIFTGLRIALGLSWILLIAAEVIASSRGLGWLIWDSRNFSRPDDMIVGIITIGVLGKITDMILVIVEKQITSWRIVFKGK